MSESKYIQEQLSNLYSYLTALYKMMAQFTKYIYFDSDSSGNPTNLNITSVDDIKLKAGTSITLNPQASPKKIAIGDTTTTNCVNIYYGSSNPTSSTSLPTNPVIGSLYIRTGTSGGDMYIFKNSNWQKFKTV